MEILDIHIPKKAESCQLNKCELSEAFSSPETINAFANSPPGSSVLKDSFILPAGGAVVVRVHTGKPALWFAHCHLETHRQNGMSLILNVGDYEAPSDKSWLPQDYPRCDTPFLQTKPAAPSCKCYSNKDAVLDGALTDDHWCSRDFLCFHEGEQANLNSYPVPSEGLHIKSEYSTPGWAISLIMVGIFTLVSMCFAYKNWLTIYISRCICMINREPKNKTGRTKRSARRTVLCDSSGNSMALAVENDEEYGKTCSSCSDDNVEFTEEAPVSIDSSFFAQLRKTTSLEWNEYRPTAVSPLRLFEVVGLALLTGALFYDVGNDKTSTGFAKVNSLLFFSVTLW